MPFDSGTLISPSVRHCLMSLTKILARCKFAGTGAWSPDLNTSLQVASVRPYGRRRQWQAALNFARHPFCRDCSRGAGAHHGMIAAVANCEREAALGMGVYEFPAAVRLPVVRIWLLPTSSKV